jgi:histidine triad (HIT) family protein
MAESDCLFCRIARKEIPAQVAYEDEAVIAFDDINPAAPVHVLVVPRRHIASLNDAVAGDEAVLGRLYTAAARVAAARGIAGSGWRATVNVGRDAHQLVGHVHLHVMGGRAFAWPPG